MEEIMSESQLRAPRRNTITITGARLVKLIRLIWMHFDRATQMYAPGWGDSRIAKETQVPRSFVQHIRLTDFGKLQRPKQQRVSPM
jgi:hypothetical protein